jgi:methyl-accepting chemotaxis protein
VRETLASDIGEPSERRALVRHVSLRQKLLVSVTGVTLVLALFAVFVTEIRSERGVELHVTRIQRNLLAEIVPLTTASDTQALEDALVRARRLGIADGIGIVSADGGEVIAGNLDGLLPSELAAIRESGLGRGDSVAFHSPNVLAWRRLASGRDVLVMVASRELLQVEEWADWAVFLAFLLVSTGLSLGLARLIASDVSGATHGLATEAVRMASGDLRWGRVIEAEDELGDLSRTFEDMGRSLRGTVQRVAEAADRVESTAGELASVSQSVAAVTADQVTGARKAAASMESIDEHVRAIADSSRVLSVSVEASSSTVLELGAAGDELNETA